MILLLFSRANTNTIVGEFPNPKLLNFPITQIAIDHFQGQYLIPSLPDAEYQIWTRGYGLADSPKQTVRPGTQNDLASVIAANDAIAAQVYPAAYWYSMMGLPNETELENIEGGLNAYTL